MIWACVASKLELAHIACSTHGKWLKFKGDSADQLMQTARPFRLYLALMGLRHSPETSEAFAFVADCCGSAHPTSNQSIETPSSKTRHDNRLLKHLAAQTARAPNLSLRTRQISPGHGGQPGPDDFPARVVAAVYAECGRTLAVAGRPTEAQNRLQRFGGFHSCSGDVRWRGSDVYKQFQGGLTTREQ